MTRVGWCPGGRTVADMLALYPGTSAVRIFVGAGKPLPAWGGAVLGGLGDALPHVSFKTWDMVALRAWLDAMPDRPLILTYAHEPEQGTAAGDPTPEVFQARWAELVAALADHPKRSLVWLVPVYTRYWWQAHPGDMVYLVDGVDAHGWDIYNNGTTYRTPDDLLTVPRDIAARTGLPYLLAELGAVDVGPGRSEWMRAMVAAAKADNAITCCWFHKDQWDLTGTAEQETWRALIEEATRVDWYLAPSLKVLRDEINARWPNRDKTSDGSIGDTAHQATNSDHNPNSRGSVDAIDVDKDGIDPYAVIKAFEQHPSAHYWIYQQQIADKDDGWQRRPYSGPNPHDHHVHFSIRQTVAAEQNTTPWGLSEDIMATLEDVRTAVQDALREMTGFQSAGIGRTAGVPTISQRLLAEYVWADGKATRSEVAALRAEVAQQAGRDLVDEAAIVAGILAGLTPEAIAAAIPPDLARQVADELAARLAS